MKDDTANRTEIDSASQAGRADSEPEAVPALQAKKQALLCDRCGFEMFQTNCKVVCPNCGNRYDCSDLTLYFD